MQLSFSVVLLINASRLETGHVLPACARRRVKPRRKESPAARHMPGRPPGAERLPQCHALLPRDLTQKTQGKQTKGPFPSLGVTGLLLCPSSPSSLHTPRNREISNFSIPHIQRHYLNESAASLPNSAREALLM